MPRQRLIQQRFTQGEIDPKMIGRTDVDQYYGAAETAQNIFTLPQGGFKRRPGLEHIGPIPKVITHLASPTITTPNGGTGSNANDANGATVLTTTTNIGVLDPYIVLSYDFTTAQSIGLVYINQIKLTAGTSADFYVQVSTNGSSWTTVGTALTLTTTEKDYTRRVHGSYRYIRLARIGATDLSTAKVTLDDFLVYSEASTSGARLYGFVFTQSQSYMMVFSDKNIAIYQNGVHQIDIYAEDYTTARLSSLDFVRQADTLLIFHEDVQTSKLQRQGANDAWTLTDVTFTNIPTYEFGAGTGGADEVQTIVFSGFAAGNTFTLQFEGFTTLPIAYSATGATTASNMQTALNALANIGASGVAVASVTADQHTITFNGTAMDKQDWETIEESVVTGSGSISINETTKGAPTGESIWSSTRGWPRHGAFYQGRLYLDGGKSRPRVGYGSVVNDPFNFDFGDAEDDDAVGPFGADEFDPIVNFYAGRNLMIFTTAGEYIIPQTFGDPITPANIAITRQSSIGSQEFLRPQEIEGGVMYIQLGGKSVQEFIFDQTQNAFGNNLVSLLSSHLVTGPVGFALRKSTSNEEGAYLLIVRDDGGLTVANILRAQGITSFTPQVTDGNFKDCGVDVDDMYFAVERTVNSVTRLYLERFNNDCYMDASTLVTTGLPQDVFTGLTHLEGEECRVRADGSVLIDRTVTGGSVTIERDAEESFEIGMNYDPIFKDLPPEIPQLGTIMGDRVNLSEVTLNVYQTSGLRVNGKLVSFRGFGPSGSGSPLDIPPPQYTGTKTVFGFSGWNDKGQVTITQDDPEPMTILSIAKRINV